jgi:hypothetical protein
MHLERVLPLRALRFAWERLVGAPKTTPLPWPFSRQGWIAIGIPSDVVPTGDQVKAQAPLGDGTRGVLTLWAPWWPAIGGDAATTAISIALLDDTVPDPVPPAYDMNPVNCAHGRMNVVTTAGQTAPTVAGFIAGTFNIMLGIAGLSGKFQAMGARIEANVARADLGNGTLALTSPKPWRMSEFSSGTGAWGTMAPGAFIAHPARIRPELYAGVRPGPQLVVGDAFAGQGEAMPIIG